MFPNVSQHPGWLPPQSKKWCDQLAAQSGKYEFTWNYTVKGLSAEDIFTEKLSKLIRGKVLDVGCGHGEYTNRWANRAEEVVGYDMTEGFLRTANRNRQPNVRFVRGYTKQDGLPFENDEFEVAYTKKGPSSWYPEANRILKPGGDVLSLHPGDGNGEGGELGIVFPGLFSPPQAGTPILDKIKRRLSESTIDVLEIRVLRETGYIPSAEDIVAMICFGQNAMFNKYVMETCFEGIRRQFDKHRTKQGIRTTGFYYFIHAKASI